MSTVSNRFYVECIDDGATLHGQLLSNKSLTQAWTGTTAVPNWTTAANQPTIYVDLLDGNASVEPDSGGTWYYNGVALEFDPTTHQDTTGKFEEVTTVIIGDRTLTNKTAIKIIDNIASSTDVDVDTITYRGTYTKGGAAIAFAATAQIRITGVSTSGVFGLIEFVGSNVVTEKNQVITMYGRLFDASGTELTSGFTTQWKKDGTSIGAGAAVTIDGTTYNNAKQVNESAITDNTIIECDFTYIVDSGGQQTSQTYAAFENIDDQTDPEQMYIQYNGSNDNSATLKPNGSITWYIWIGTQTDPTVDSTWANFGVKLLNAEGNEVTADITGIPNRASSGTLSGWRPLDVDPTTHKASITLTYAQVKENFGNYLTAIVLAVK